MSTRNGDKARANRERKKKELRNKRTQELRRVTPSKTPAESAAGAPANSDDQLVTSRLRQVPENNQGAAGQGESGLEIVMYRAPADEPRL